MNSLKADQSENVGRIIQRLKSEEPLTREERDELIDLLQSSNSQFMQDSGPALKPGDQPGIQYAKLLKVLGSMGDQANFAIFLKDYQNRYMYVNREWRRQFGVGNQPVIGKTVFDIFDPVTARRLYEQDENVLKSKTPILEEEFIQNSDGPRYYNISKFPITNFVGIKEGMAGIATDITELKRAEEKVKRSETRLNLAQRIAEIGCWELDLFTNELVWSDEIYRIFEIDQVEFEASYESFLGLVHPDDRELVDRVYTESLENHTTYHIQHRLSFPNGRVKFVEEHGEHFYNAEGIPVRTIGTVQDVTEREYNQQQLRDSLKEKQALLAEIHHRVKNNLAVVSGMLQLQWFEEDNPETAGKLLDSFNRIQSIARIHEQLYQSNQFSEIDLSRNLKQFASDLVATMQNETQIDLHYDCQPVHLNMKQALPSSLVVNEVITNIIKHAFVDRDKGSIQVKLREEKGQVELQIKDNGIGLPADFDPSYKGSLGMKLIETLARQLHAEYRYSSSSPGTTFTLLFNVED